MIKSPGMVKVFTDPEVIRKSSLIVQSPPMLKVVARNEKVAVPVFNTCKLPPIIIELGILCNPDKFAQLKITLPKDWLVPLGKTVVVPIIFNVDPTSHVEAGMVPPAKACSYVPPEAKESEPVVVVICPTVPPPPPSFFKVPYTVVRLFVELYLPPPPTAVTINVPSIAIDLLLPVNATVKAPAVPLIVSVLPAPIEFPVLSIVKDLAPIEVVKETATELLIVRLLIVTVLGMSIVALMLITTS